MSVNTGSFGPATIRAQRRRLVSIESMEVGPEELAAQLPAVARLLRTLPGPDRPDYYLLGLQRPLRMRTSVRHLNEVGVDLRAADPRCFTVRDDGSVDGLVHGLVVTPRTVGDLIDFGSVAIPIATAYVLDASQMADLTVNLTKIFYAAITRLTVLN